MKKNYLKNLIANLFPPLLGVAVLFASAPSWGKEKVDRRYALESIGYLKAWDNADGLFAQYVKEAYDEYFARSSRFILRDLNAASKILSRSTIPYKELIEDDQVLSRVAKATKVETVIRTKIYKEGPRYRFVLDWLFSPKMERLADYTFYLDDPAYGETMSFQKLKMELKQGLERLLEKVPFRGHVTGRDAQWITVNIGENSGLKKGDILVIGTLEEVKKHPLLKTFVDWSFLRTGRLIVEEVNPRIAFCKIEREVAGRQIQAYQKIVDIIRGDGTHTVVSDPENEALNSTVDLEYPGSQTSSSSGKEKRPQYGWVKGDLWLASFSREHSGGAVIRSGSGFLIGMKVDGQIWFTRNFFGELELGYGFFNYSQENVSTNPPSESIAANSTLFRFRMDGGYSHPFTESFYGPKGYVRLGYKSLSYGLPIDTSKKVGTFSMGSVFLGVGANLSLRDVWGIHVGLDLGMIRTAEETGFTTGSKDGTSDVSFMVGANYRIAPNLEGRFSLEVVSQGVEFTQGSKLDHRVVSFLPALLYYF